ncbi:MAG TPA: radical SAM protein, partial [Bacteroidales bacterium]|nr:radical SAM protein [Bacteroidales bacterium]
IVITGVNIGRYDSEGLRFEDVLERVLELDGDFRVRISSIEPDGFSDRFPALFNHPKLVPHLHLCLQSGSDKVLMQMRRMYTVKSYMDIINTFRKQYADFNFTTDIIVGFPGETREEFMQTCDVVKEAGFSHIHTFRYSQRTGTRAARMTDQVPEKLKAERSEAIRAISDSNKERYYNSMLGLNQRVLIEKPDADGYAKGYGEHYIPVIIPGIKTEQNEFVNVVLKSVSTDDPSEVVAGLVNENAAV